MESIHVRQLDDEVVERLRRRAARNRRSLESEVRHILERAAEDGMPEKARRFGATIKRLRTGTGGHPQTPSHVLIREDRDNGHGPG